MCVCVHASVYSCGSACVYIIINAVVISVQKLQELQSICTGLATESVVSQVIIFKAYPHNDPKLFFQVTLER